MQILEGHLYQQVFVCGPIVINIAVLFITGIDFKIKTVELGGKKIKLQIWYVKRPIVGKQILYMFAMGILSKFFKQ